MDALCRGLPKYLFLQEDTYRDKRSRYRASACWAMALPMADRFDRTTSGAPSFSLARSTIHIPGKPRLEIAALVLRLFLRVALESDGDPQTICNSDQAMAPQSSRHQSDSVDRE